MKILFICTGNTCRSPMAEGILRDLAEKNNLNIVSQSAGIFASTGSGAAENAVKALGSLGIDISNHRASTVNEDMIIGSDLILTMSMSHKRNLISYFPTMAKKIFLLNEYAFNIERDIEDPFGMGMDYYEKARDEIYRAIEEIVNRRIG